MSRNHEAAPRRRRALALTIVTAAAVVGILGGTAALPHPAGGSGTPPPAGSPTPGAPASDMRLVGLGHAAIAVPRSWGTNVTRCGVPTDDTVVLDVGAVETCAMARPRGVESVEVIEGEPHLPFTADETLTVDGVQAHRQRTRCELELDDTEVCTGTVHIPSIGVSFRAESSTSAADVGRILEQIRLLPDRIGVPGHQTLALTRQGRSGQAYLGALRSAGLTAHLRTKKMPGVAAGYVLDASPQPGTMLRREDVVVVTVVAEPDGPAEEVRVGVNSSDASGDTYKKSLTDAQIRAGSPIELTVGDRIWAYAAGRRAATLAGNLDGGSVTVDDWKVGPNYPHSWVAVAPGRTRIRLTVTADGTPVQVGVVTVIVN